MILNLLILVVVGLVVYWHYLQGFFSAALSAILAVVAAVVALGFHEPVVNTFNQGKFNSQAHALVLVCLFAGVYLVLRVIFDKLIPGNVRFPVALDKAGSIACGLIAGLSGGGVLAIAAQSLPFATSSLAHHRWEIVEESAAVRVQGRSQIQDAKFEHLRDPEKFMANQEPNSLWTRADEFVEQLVAKVSSAEGSLSAGRPWRSVHPDYLQELFGQRLGRQVGSRATALADRTQVAAVFVAESFPQKDPETFQIGESDIGVRGGPRREEALKKVKDPRRPASDANTLLVVRLTLHRDDADDKTGAVAFGPANVRLVAPDASAEGQWKNYYPIGTLEAGSELYVAYPDDWLFVDQDKAVDLVFEVSKKDVFQTAAAGGEESSGAKSAAPPAAELKFRDDVFIEFKRLARIRLSDLKVQPSSRIRTDPTFATVSVRRKGDAQQGVAQGGDQPPPPTPTATGATLAPEGGAVLSTQIPAPIGVDDASATIRDALRSWGGSYDLERGRVTRLKIDVSASRQVIGQGNASVSEFAAPDGHRMVQIVARPVGDDKWAWAGELGRYKLATASGAKIEPAGFWADTQNAQGVIYPAARYNIRDPLEGATAEYTPTTVTLLFLVPVNTEVKALEYNDQFLHAVEISVR